MRAIFVIFLLTMLSGCVGLAAGTYGKKELARTEFSLEKERNIFSFEKRDLPYSEDEIIEHWGSPDSVGLFEQCKVLIYKDGTSWSGAGAFVGIVPVPLVAPTGTYKNRFYLRNNVAVGLIQEYGEVDRAVGYTCGSNKCGASSGEKVNEPEVDAEVALTEWCAKPL
ncbi:hypothetical protein [Microbulbifer marinus]|uniref:hypothetical protein n=1 Tax=Microbulbifer marinus TaxID=658218 RepID=UPI00111515B0|nr:hypothetical protein [Microbulbifer marinus]